jgi:hypothetical protein
LAPKPGKFGLDLGETVAEPGSLLRRAFADLVYLPGQLANVSFDLVEPVAQFHEFGGGAFIRGLWPGGSDTRQLAAELYVSQNTMQDHLKAIFAGTGSGNRRAGPTVESLD